MLIGQDASDEYRLGRSSEESTSLFSSTFTYDVLMENRFGRMKSFWKGLSLYFFPAKKTPQRNDSLCKWMKLCISMVWKNNKNWSSRVVDVNSRLTSHQDHFLSRAPWPWDYFCQSVLSEIQQKWVVWILQYYPD